jgi:hypothetical protein
MHATLRRLQTRFDSWRGHLQAETGDGMAKKVFYRQCRLVKKIENGELQLVSWIPEPHAVTGRIVKLRDDDGAWDDGWVVVGAGENRLPADQVPDFHQISKAHLRATGDAETAPKD